MPDLTIPATITQDEIVEEIANNWSRDEVMEFILKLDLHLADFDFTVELRDKLTKSLEGEGESENGFDFTVELRDKLTKSLEGEGESENGQ